VTRLLLAGLALLGLACEPDDGLEAPRWEVALSNLPGALLGVMGTSASDVWAVGADVGEGPTVLHFDGAAWHTLDTGQRGTLWWVATSSPTADVWVVGEAGLALRYDRTTDRFERIEGVPAAVTLYGVLITDSDVWAVGGDDRGRVFRLDGEAFTEDPIPDGTDRLFKVWGTTSDDLWAVGLGDTILRRSSDGWRALPSPVPERLTTVHGNGSLTVAVGGFLAAQAVELGDALVDISPPSAKALNGVWVTTDGAVVAVGVEGTVLERSGSVWRAPSSLPTTLDDYHAVYVDPDGGVWAVGGFIVVEPQRRGMLLHYGPPIPGL
jgi:hypothetical protein